MKYQFICRRNPSNAISVMLNLLFNLVWKHTLSQFMKESSLFSLFMKDQGVFSAIFVQKDSIYRQAWMVTLFLFISKMNKYFGKDFAHDLESWWSKNENKTLIWQLQDFLYSRFEQNWMGNCPIASYVPEIILIDFFFISDVVINRLNNFHYGKW